MIIKTIEQLKELANNDYGVDCYIQLNHGLKSTKLIQYFEDSDEWYIYNLIDSTSEKHDSTTTFKKSIVILMVSYISNDTVTKPLAAGAKDYIFS